MRQNSISSKDLETLQDITYLLGDIDSIVSMPLVSARIPFDEEVIDFLNACSRNLMQSQAAKGYADIITLGFWMRKSSVMRLKERFVQPDGTIQLGRGTAFHIAPSNVPVNYAYSLVTGLLTGNANIVRIPSKDFPQVSIINQVIAQTLEEFENIRPYICLVRYDRNEKINNYLSAISDTRIVWGGDHTIAELRKSPMGPRAGEVTFADRYSLAIIDSDQYLASEQKERIAEAFYNDTFLTDQNACTSPRLVVWTGTQKEKAKEIFWEHEHELVKRNYTFQPIMGIHKLTSSYLAAAAWED